MNFLWLATGLALLTGGAELLVRGGAALARAARISPLVIGLTIVAYGTSAPELVVSLQSALHGQADLSVGNVVGSNIFNVLFILGISALIIPLVVNQQLIRFDVPLMIALSLGLWLLALDGSISRFDGGLLLVGMVSYTGWVIWQSRNEDAAIHAEYAAQFGDGPPAFSWRALLLNVVLLAVGLALLIAGSHLFTDASVKIARAWGISELVIGLTIVAAGTSLPEVATSILAAIRGERDIAVGNVVGSNLFNIMGVLGAAGCLSPTGLPVSEAALWFDIPVMIGVALGCLPIFFTGHVIARWEGALFFAYYCCYTGYLILKASGSDAAPHLATAMTGFVLPLTALTLLITMVRAILDRRRLSSAHG